jgi:hypothetical protein
MLLDVKEENKILDCHCEHSPDRHLERREVNT